MAEKILVVDDELDTLRLVGLMLEKQGFEIIAASNGEQAVTMAQNEKPDLILLDIMMPDMDGINVARRLRSDERTHDLSIIMFTAKNQVEDKILGFDAGADDYLTKPIQPRELVAHVKAVLARAGKSKPIIATVPQERGFTLGVLAARGGLGVSTLVLNLAFSIFTLSKKDVIVAEFRPGQATVSLELGYLRSEGLSHLLQRKPAEIDAQAVEMELATHNSGVRLLLASSQPRDALLLNNVASFEAIARQLSQMARYIVFDLGASLTPMTEKVLPYMDNLIVVVEPVPQTILQTKSLLEDLTWKGIGEGRIDVVLVNRIRSGMQLSWGQAQDQLGRTITAIITPAPELAYQASLHNIPMVIQQPDSLTAQQFTKLAEKVTQRNR